VSGGGNKAPDHPALLGDGHGVIGVVVAGDATGAVFILRCAPRAVTGWCYVCTRLFV
jgi:hypothetical protein